MKSVSKFIIYILVAIVVIFVLIQFVPYGRSHTNPTIVKEPNWDTAQTRDLAKRACFDCHSNESIWPWYSNFAPVSWLVQHDVDDARKVFNFSDITSGRYGKQGSLMNIMEASAEVINEGEMPPFQYLPLHPSAKLTDAEKQQLIQGLITTGHK